MKKIRLLFMLPLAAFLLVLLAVSAFAADGQPLGALSVNVDGQTIFAAAADGEMWFLLPSHTDLHSVPISFQAPENAAVLLPDGSPLRSGEAADVAAMAVRNDDDGSLVLTCTVVPQDGAPTTVRLCFLKSENVGSMFLTVADPAYGRAWIESSRDHSADAADRTDVSMRMQTADGAVVYNGALTSLRGRGNSTWQDVEGKKPYQIKLDKKTDLLSTGNKANKNKTWVLLANTLDKSLLKNAVALDLARYLGLSESPEYTFVDLYFDGEYRGAYLLTEKPQINPGRVDIAELESHNTVTDENAKQQGVNSWGLKYQYNPTAVCDADAINGGYLLESDAAFHAKENSWFEVYDGRIIVVKSPEFCTKAQIEYISVLFNEAVKAAETNGYHGKSVIDYFNVDSLAALYLVNEYMQNIDFLNSSTYYFLPDAGNATYENKLYAGPAWDFDVSLGCRKESVYRDPARMFWIDDYAVMFKGTVIRSAIKEKAKALNAAYDTLFSETPVSAQGLHSFSWFRSTLDMSQKMNFTVWSFNDSDYIPAYPTYEENYEYARNYLEQRHRSILPELMQKTSVDYAALQHCMQGNHAVVSPIKAPTCTEAGLAGAYCEVCGTVFEEGHELPAGHEDANGDRLCDRCGAYVGSAPAALAPILRYFFLLLRFLKQLFSL